MVIIFSTSKRLVSRIIRWVTGETVSHVALLMTIGKVPVILHADVGGIQFAPMRKFLANNVVVAAYQKTRCADGCSLDGAVGAIGDPYDYASLFTRACAKALRWLGLAFRNPLVSPRSMVCSEFVARCILDFAAYDPEEVTPGDMLQHCQRDDTFEPYDIS